MNISFTKAKVLKEKPNPDSLKFGRYFTDHMFIMNYTKGKGWHDPRVVPYADISLSPAAMVFHYGQEMFEGLKAYKNSKGEVRLFRPEKNIERMNNTNDRLCIPRVNPEDALQAIEELVLIERDWIPDKPGTSLYIRPFIIATDAFLGVRVSETYLFMIILSPVGSYYATGINPVSICVESEYVRAVRGGTGFAKAGGNYAASLIGQQKAASKGYEQVLWLDGVERKYIDEVGAMNVFFVLGDEIITPELGGSILPGVTRDSVISLLKFKGYKVTERRISMEEIFIAAEDGNLKEMFGTGTAAVISPVGKLDWNGKVVEINQGKIGEVSKMLYDNITGIQYGDIKDEFGWSKVIG